ncbi:hypothetical protein [Kitasatospora camelliae]|uniref:Uncharacterized protein n=1 Tax=Kitasatospora camelliae TaxID=3156397 RepID=A0AAU8K0T4_9ACTN
MLGSRSGGRKREAAARFAAYAALLELARGAGAPVAVPAGWARERAGVSGERADDAGLLPVVPAQLIAQRPEVHREAFRLGAERGVDYLDERSVRELLAAQRRAVGRIRVWAVWCTLALCGTGAAAGVALTLVRGSAGRGGLFVAAGVLGAVCALLLGQVLRSVRGWRVSGVADRAHGYLLLLEAAHRGGVAVPALPSWLDIRERSKKWS